MGTRQKMALTLDKSSRPLPTVCPDTQLLSEPLEPLADGHWDETSESSGAKEGACVSGPQGRPGPQPRPPAPT